MRRLPLDVAASQFNNKVFRVPPARGEVVRILLGAPDVDPNAQDELGSLPQHHAVKSQRGVEETLPFLLDHERIRAEVTDIFGLAPFMYALHRGAVPAVRARLDFTDYDLAAMLPNGGDLDIDVLDDRYTQFLFSDEPMVPRYMSDELWTPLMHASVRGHLGVAMFLCGDGLFPLDAKDHGGRDAMAVAVGYGHQKPVNYLMELESRTESLDWADSDKEGTTLLMLAERNGGNTEIIILLSAREQNAAV